MGVSMRFPAPRASEHIDSGPKPQFNVALVLRVVLGLMIVVGTTLVAGRVSLWLWWVLTGVGGWLAFAPAMEWWHARRQRG